MISRVWRGWTTPENADKYQKLLVNTIMPAIRARSSAGYIGMRVDRRGDSVAGKEVEFVTTMLFEGLDAVVAFAGPEYRVAVVPPAARQLLARFDAESAHYEVVGSDSPR